MPPINDNVVLIADFLLYTSFNSSLAGRYHALPFARHHIAADELGILLVLATPSVVLVAPVVPLQSQVLDASSAETIFTVTPEEKNTTPFLLATFT